MAQPEASSTPASDASVPIPAKERAQRLLDEGLALVGQAEFQPALERFENAYELFPSDKLLLNIGSALRYLGRNADAARVFELYLQDNADAPRRAEVKAILDELSESTAWLSIQTEVWAAELRVDGQRLPRRHPDTVGQAQQETVRWRVDPGRHVVWARRPQMPPALQSVDLAAGEELQVRLHFERVEGKERLVLVPVENSAQPYVGAALLGLGVIGLGVGTAFAVGANSTDDQAALHCRMPTECDAVGQTLGERAKDEARISTIAFAVGATTAAAGIVVWLTSSTDETAVSITPTAAGMKATVQW